MPVTEQQFDELQRRVNDIDSVIKALKLVAAILGLSGAAILAGLYWVSTKASDAAATADRTKELSTKALQDVKAAADVAVGRVKDATSDSLRAFDSYLASATITPEFSWEQGAAPTHLGVNEGKGICYLTRVTGAFTGGGEEVAIQVVRGEYVLTGKSQKWAIGASARCLKLRRG